MTSLSDILTAIKNLVQAVYTLALHSQTSPALSAATVVATGNSCTLLSVAVTVAGSASGTINNCTTTGAASASNVLMAVPNTVGVTVLGVWGIAASLGLTVVPGSGQSISITYSQRSST